MHAHDDRTLLSWRRRDGDVRRMPADAPESLRLRIQLFIVEVHGCRRVVCRGKDNRYEWPRAGIDDGDGRDRDRLDRTLEFNGTAEPDEVHVDRQPQLRLPSLARLRLHRPGLERRTISADLQRQRQGAIRWAVAELDGDVIGPGGQREAAVVNHAYRLRIRALLRLHAENELGQRIRRGAFMKRVVDERRRARPG